MRRVVLFLRRGEEEEPGRLLVERRGSACRIDGDLAGELDARRLPDGRFSLLFEDGRQLCGRADEGGDGVKVTRDGRAASVPLSRTRPGTKLAPEAGAGGVEEIRALMHGRIVEVRVVIGDHVEQGALLAVLEAMKMQNEIRASASGLIERLSVSAGQTIEGGEFMLSIRSDSN